MIVLEVVLRQAAAIYIVKTTSEIRYLTEYKAYAQYKEVNHDTRHTRPPIIYFVYYNAMTSHVHMFKAL